MSGTPESLQIGWAEADLTPEQNVILAGQFHARVSEGILDPVIATVLVIEAAGPVGALNHAIMITCDLASISDELRDGVRERVRAEVPGIDPRSILMGATHTHAAPEVRFTPYGMPPDYQKQMKGADKVDKFGMWPDIGLDVIPPADYAEWAVGRIAAAVKRAWENRAPGAVAYGLGQAVVGRNRRLTYRDGTSRMYGNPATPDFRHVEGYEDHSVYALMTYDRDRNLTGMVVNVPCPSQVSEHIYQISADFWHETRQELRRRFGPGLFVLAQCAPAGDQSPHVLINKRAEERMWRLKGRDMGQNAPREEIARKIADALADIVPHAEREIDWNPRFAHTVEVLDLPRRLISEQDVEDALAEALPFKEKYAECVAELARNPAIRNSPRWYTEITKTYRRMERGERVKERFELQRKSPALPIEVHALRIGDTAFATNPFELYLDYAVRIREICRATQTFLIQKAGSSGTYLPSERSIAHGGYGSVPASTDIGPEGGDLLVEWTVEALNRLWE